MSKNYRAVIVEARRSYADGITDSVTLARQFKVSPNQINIWRQTYDFDGYTERRESMRAELAVVERLSEEDDLDDLDKVISLLKQQLVFAVREGDIIFSNVQEVKTFIEAMHLIQGKPTQITKEIEEDLTKKEIKDLTGDEAVALAMRMVGQA